MDKEVEFSCPYCGELNTVIIDSSEGMLQNFVQDCEVCCRPVELNVYIDRNGIIELDAKNDEGF